MRVFSADLWALWRNRLRSETERKKPFFCLFVCFCSVLFGMFSETTAGGFGGISFDFSLLWLLLLLLRSRTFHWPPQISVGKKERKKERKKESEERKKIGKGLMLEAFPSASSISSGRKAGGVSVAIFRAFSMEKQQQQQQPDEIHKKSPTKRKKRNEQKGQSKKKRSFDRAEFDRARPREHPVKEKPNKIPINKTSRKR